MLGNVHELDQHASGQDDLYAEMLQRAHALVPKLRERAAITEEMRRLPPETENDLHAAGLFRILQPKRVGGSELDYVALVDFADAIGLADASVAWNLANLASHHWMLGMFDKRAQDLIWNESADTLIASSFVFPAGRDPCKRRLQIVRALAVFVGRGFKHLEYARRHCLIRR